MYHIKAVLRSIIIFTICLLPCISVYGGTLNPSTGDTSGRYIWIVAAIAAVALIVLILTTIIGKRNGKK